MKTKFRLFSAFAAFACVLASGFARGEDAMMPVIENSNHQELKYEVSRTVYDGGAESSEMFICVSNAVEDAESGDELNLLLPVKLAGTSVICIDKVLTLKIKPFEDLSRCQLIFRVLPGGKLTVANTGSFIGAFLVDGGELCLRGGTFYTDGVNPVVSSSQNDSKAKIEIDGAQILGKYQNATRFSQSPVAIDLGGVGSFAMCNGATIAPYLYYYNGHYYTNIFNTAINVHRGNVSLDNVSIVANDYALAIGYGDDYQGEGVFTISNMTKLVSVRSGGVYARASTNSIDITLCDTTITSLDGGVKLDYNKRADIQPSVHKHAIEMDGSTTIRTQSLFGDYAIRDVSNCQYWDVDIRRGTYYRMRQSFGDEEDTFSVTNKWVNPESVASWDPIDAEDNLTMIVTCDKEDEITVIFNGYGSYPAVKDGTTDLEKTQIGFNGTVTNTYYIPHGGSWPLASITPESIGWTNSMGVFAGWYDSYDNARALKGALTAVPKSKTLYAGWRPCVVSFHHCIDEVVDYFNKTGLARRVVNDKVNIEDFKPATFGYENPGQSFVGWYFDKDYSGSAVTSLSVPVATNLYARWIEKTGVAWIEGTTNTYRTVAEAIDAAGTNVVVLIGDVKDEAPIVVSNTTGIALNGYAIGDAGRAAGDIFELAGTNAYLKIFGEEGAVYGTISVGDNAWLELEGGTYICKEGMVVSATGAKFNVLATDAVFKGPKGEVALDFAGSGGCAILSNSTVACESSGAVDIAINVENCEVRLVGSKVAAEYSGLMLTNGICTVEKSSISATMGIMAYPSTIKVSDSTITSTSTNGADEAYAFCLEAGPEGSNGCSLELRGENTVVGGVYDTSRAHAFLSGGAFYYEGIWADALKRSIWGGTYSHQMSNEVVMAWIATNCVCVWESETRFTVTDPNANYAITYDLWTNLPKDAQDAVNEGTAILTNSNPEAYGASTKYLKLNDARCTGEDGYKCEFMGWYLSDGVNSNQVVAISNGCVVVKVNGKSKLTDITGSLSLVAKWGNWMVLPYSVYFASGVVIKEVDEDDPTFVTYHEVDLHDEEDMAANKVVLVGGFPLDGLEYHAGDKSITLPSGIIWEGHRLSGWALYDPDDITTPEFPPETTNTFFVGENDLSKFVDADGNLLDGITLHAVWDQGGDSDFNPTFDDMYNDVRDKIMTGGDTYVGYVMSDEEGGGLIGKIVVKLGTPKSDGFVGASIKVTLNGKGSRSFSVKKDIDQSEYRGNEVRLYVERNGEGEDDQHVFDLTLDSKTISGLYNGYKVVGGVNLFKGTESDRAKAESAISPFLGRWMFIFATTKAETMATDKHGEAIDEVKVEDGEAHAWGYSYVGMEIRDKGKVKLTGKLANGLEVSATATAIIGDRMMCVPATCAVYSGKRGGGFGFTAYFRNGDSTNDIFAASLSTNAVCEAAVDADSVSLWDSTMSKKMPFSATVVYTNWQRVADIEMPNEMLFCVDPKNEDPRGLLWNFDRIGEMVGTDDEAEAWLPLDPLQYQFGYSQYIDAIPANDSTYKLKVRGKTPKMRLVDDSYIVPGRKGDNYAAVKVKYDNKRGTFSGSFKVYTLKMDDETFEYHLKKTKVSVSGAMADGRGWGFGHHKKAGSQPITLEDAAFSNRTSIVAGAAIDVGDDDSGELGGGGEGEEGVE